MNSNGVEVLLYLNIPMLPPEQSVLKGVIRNSCMKKSSDLTDCWERINNCEV